MKGYFDDISSRRRRSSLRRNNGNKQQRPARPTTFRGCDRAVADKDCGLRSAGSTRPLATIGTQKKVHRQGTSRFSSANASHPGTRETSRPLITVMMHFLAAAPTERGVRDEARAWEVGGCDRPAARASQSRPSDDPRCLQAWFDYDSLRSIKSNRCLLPDRKSPARRSRYRTSQACRFLLTTRLR